MATRVYDEQGRAVRGEQGELVCTAPFPSMPLGFWSDADGTPYRAAYFERFPDVWCHGDYAVLTEHDGIVILGRSDATLNPGGVRIGTAEIYRQVEQLPEVAESIAVGTGLGGRRAGRAVRAAAAGRDARRRARAPDPRHDPRATPRRVTCRRGSLQVADIPRTISGKIIELAVRDVIHGRPVRNTDALANPEALEHFRDRPELAS